MSGGRHRRQRWPQGRSVAGGGWRRISCPPELRVRVFTMIGQVLVFRVANAMVLRRMRWDAIGDRERALIKRIVVEHAHAILDAAAVR